MAVVTNEQLFQRYFDECANGGNLDLCDEIFAADYQHHDPANPDPRPVVGPQGVKAHLESLKGGFPDLVFDVEDTISDGDQIIVKWTARGTNTGDYFGMPATGKPIEISGMNTWRTRDGQAIEGWVNRDDMGLLQQLGVIPSH
ncbi:MAG TPA: ester cyclase [Gaiellaceae bacterium]|nr:ester cyclase [Thermoanaerobaculia bacterium]